MDDVRLDKYLWAVRIFKTRSDAAEAIRTNRVTVGGATCKPSREVRIGDVIAVKRMPVVYQYKVWCTTWAKPSRATFPPSRNGGRTKRTRRRCSPAG